MNSSVVLLNLLRISLGNSAEWKGEGNVDWKEVIELARKQGVLAIAFDALEKVPAELCIKALPILLAYCLLIR